MPIIEVGPGDRHPIPTHTFSTGIEAGIKPYIKNVRFLINLDFHMHLPKYQTESGIMELIVNRQGEQQVYLSQSREAIAITISDRLWAGTTQSEAMNRNDGGTYHLC